jgi:dihydrofolate reductase
VTCAFGCVGANSKRVLNPDLRDDKLVETRYSSAAGGSGMAKLIYISNVSLDGYIEDEHGNLDWTDPSDEVFVFITDLVRSVGTYLYGRRLYDTMAVWETDPALAAQSELMGDFANAWRAADKVVYSTTLDAVPIAKTKLARDFDPDSVRDMKASATSDLTVGGAELAAHAFKAGLVDEFPPVHLPRTHRSRQAITAGRHARRARAAGRTPVQQRCRVPPPPHLPLTNNSNERNRVAGTYRMGKSKYVSGYGSSLST